MDGTRSDLLLDTEAIDAEFHSVADAEILGWVETESDSMGVPVEMTSPGRRVMNRLR